jgi:tRNA(adenine34) deaminase
MIGGMSTRCKDDDLRFMAAAVAEAGRALARGEVPVGAIVVEEGRILSRGSNRPVRTSDPTAHAEIVALRRAARKKGNYRLKGCDLYVTVEPCAMCLGAIVHARIRRLVYGTTDGKAGAVRSVMVFPFEKLNHRPEIREGVRAVECRRLLRDFFEGRRKRAAPSSGQPA